MRQQCIEHGIGAQAMLGPRRLEQSNDLGERPPVAAADAIDQAKIFGLKRRHRHA
jgi:hypothetical protein